VWLLGLLSLFRLVVGTFGVGRGGDGG